MRRYALGWSLVATKSRILILGSAFSKELLLQVNVDDKLNSEFRATQQKGNERTDKYKLGRRDAFQNTLERIPGSEVES